MAYASWSVVFGEQPSAAKWNILGTNDASFNDGSGLGAASIAASKMVTAPSRFVPLVPAVSLADLDPSATTWTSVDVTANTTATTTAVLLQVGISSSTTVGRLAYVRQTGSAAAQDSLTIAVANPNATGTKAWGSVIVATDASQSFDYSVSNADVNAVTVILRGYFENPA